MSPNSTEDAVDKVSELRAQVKELSEAVNAIACERNSAQEAKADAVHRAVVLERLLAEARADAASARRSRELAESRWSQAVEAARVRSEALEAEAKRRKQDKEVAEAWAREAEADSQTWKDTLLDATRKAHLLGVEKVRLEEELAACRAEYRDLLLERDALRAARDRLATRVDGPGVFDARRSKTCPGSGNFLGELTPDGIQRCSVCGYGFSLSPPAARAPWHREK